MVFSHSPWKFSSGQDLKVLDCKSTKQNYFFSQWCMPWASINDKFVVWADDEVSKIFHDMHIIVEIIKISTSYLKIGYFTWGSKDVPCKSFEEAE